MAKDQKSFQKQESVKRDMSMEESRAYRASLAKPKEKVLSDSQKREEFRKFWALNKRQYGKAKDLEPILWEHIKASKMDSPEKFEAGLAHFGLKKVK
jgi:hypothetical protein